MARSGASRGAATGGVGNHASTHVDGNADEINGDLIDITFTPSNYIPNDSAPEANDVDDLAAHLQGIDDKLAAVVASTSYLFAYDTTTQTISVNNTYQDVTFTNNGQDNGWTHTPGTAEFTAIGTGIHYVVVTGNVEKSGGSSPVASIRCTINGVEVPGSQFGMDLTSNNTTFVVTRNFMVSVVANDIMRIQFAGSTTTVTLTPGPNPGGSATIPSITLTTQRVT